MCTTSVFVCGQCLLFGVSRLYSAVQAISSFLLNDFLMYTPNDKQVQKA